MILKKENNIYKMDESQPFNNKELNNKLFATFVKQEDIDETIKNVTSNYNIMYNKIFILYIKSNNEYVCTYNIDNGNINSLPLNTILVHRKKEFNVLYSLNALNELIKKLNEGIVDTKFPINWQHYKNTILLTHHDELKFLKTKIYKIIEL